MKRFAFAALAAMAVALPSVSHATTINITSQSFSMGSKDGVLSIAAGGPFNGANASFGQFKLDGVNVSAGNSPVTYYTYCVDLFHALTIPGSYTIAPLSTLFSATQATNITKLLANVNPANTDQSAALQLAIWEIAFDASAQEVTGGANQGQFYVTGGSSNPAAQTLANSYIASLAGWSVPTGTTAQLLYNRNNQSQVFLSAVPEAGTWLMMITGFGIAGASMRVRRRRISYSLA